MPARKGQEVIDRANARKRAAEKKEDTAPPVKASDNDMQALVTTPESGFEKPKTLRQLEQIVESNAAKGAKLWKVAAEALLVIKEQKLWRNSINPQTDKPYGSFVAYAEGRFGFKKTYAYDLAKAAQRKPEALTEGEAREAMRAERGTKPLTVEMALDRIRKAWEQFENKTGDYRDRTYEASPEFVKAFDVLHAHVQEQVSAFLTHWQPIPGQVVDPIADERHPVSADAENEDIMEPSDDELAEILTEGNDEADDVPTA
jgi:hypothetical protein